MQKRIITLLLLVCQAILHAQTENLLIYKEYDPDFEIVLTFDQQYDTDINDDGLSDIRFITWMDHLYYIGASAIVINGWTTCSYRLYDIEYDNVFFDLSIPLNDTSLVWGGRCFATKYSSQPLTYMVGLRYIDGEDCYYGWAEFQETNISDTQVSFHIVKTCYCAIPNYPLLWGQTSLNEGFEENETTAFETIFPNPSRNNFFITGKDLKQAEVFNALGQRVATVKGQGEQLTVNISNLPEGVYFVNITDGEGRKCVKKVVKE